MLNSIQPSAFNYTDLILINIKTALNFVCPGLPDTKLGNFIQNHVNAYLKKKNKDYNEVTVKVLSCQKKVVEVNPEMKKR